MVVRNDQPTRRLGDIFMHVHTYVCLRYRTARIHSQSGAMKSEEKPVQFLQKTLNPIYKRQRTDRHLMPNLCRASNPLAVCPSLPTSCFFVFLFCPSPNAHVRYRPIATNIHKYRVNSLCLLSSLLSKALLIDIGKQRRERREEDTEDSSLYSSQAPLRTEKDFA